MYKRNISYQFKQLKVSLRAENVKAIQNSGKTYIYPDFQKHNRRNWSHPSGKSSTHSEVKLRAFDLPCS